MQILRTDGLQKRRKNRTLHIDYCWIVSRCLDRLNQMLTVTSYDHPYRRSSQPFQCDVCTTPRTIRSRSTENVSFIRCSIIIIIISFFTYWWWCCWHVLLQFSSNTTAERMVLFFALFLRPQKHNYTHSHTDTQSWKQRTISIKLPWSRLFSWAYLFNHKFIMPMIDGEFNSFTDSMVLY